MSCPYKIVLQRGVPAKGIPPAVSFRKWGIMALAEQKRQKRGKTSAEVTIRVVTADEMTDLNGRYRHKKYPTNVLSFPLSSPSDAKLVGDIVICAEVVAREAKIQKKSPRAHFAHMVVHGMLHLLGHDHEKEAEALVMEAEEIRILSACGFPDPYGGGCS